MKLAAKLVSGLLLGIVLLLGVDGYFSIQRETELYETNMEHDALLLGRAMRGLVADSWRADGGVRAKQLIEDANHEEHEVHIRWVWLDTSSDSDLSPQVPLEKLGPAVRGEETSLKAREQDGDEYLHTYIPIAVDEKRPGALELSESLSELAQYSRHSLISTLVLMGVLLLGSGLLVVPLGIRLVGRPLHRLVEKTRQVGKGDLSRPLHLRGHDEIAEVAAALNVMCEQLAESQEQIRAEATARIAVLEQLRHADRLKTVGRLASGMAHELGTPLNVVSARGALIAEGTLSDAEIVESGNIIKAQSERITAIVRQLLDFARRSVPHRVPVDLRQVAEQTIRLLTSFAKKRKVKMSLAGDDIDATTEADAGQIQQVLTNLIVNAIQAMPEGGKVEVAIRREHACPPEGHDGSEGEYVCLSVRDEGVGISEENMRLLFEPFFTTKDIGKGTGLGLSIAYGIVGEHGGWIDVASEPEEGSCFSVYLPQEVDGCTKES
ncbi:MAG: HAMP domain-containing protein [Candidatus Nealsonbacteria bacterium]|nr:HAMP domain-containing protein [Candidatus Nealsonbacteria bacterium]